MSDMDKKPAGDAATQMRLQSKIAEWTSPSRIMYLIIMGVVVIGFLGWLFGWAK